MSLDLCIKCVFHNVFRMVGILNFFCIFFGTYEYMYEIEVLEIISYFLLIFIRVTGQQII